MEVLASTNRMSQLHSSHFTLLVKMAPDCGHNTTGLAFIATQEFFVTYCITFVFFLLCMVPYRVQLVDILCKLLRFNIFIGIFVKILCIWNIILGLYRVMHECGHSQAPALELQKEKHEQDLQSLQSTPPLNDEYLVGIQTRQTLVIEDNSSLLTPLTIDEPEQKETFQMTKQPESIADTIPEGETLISQVTPYWAPHPVRIPKSNTGIRQKIFQTYGAP